MFGAAGARILGAQKRLWMGRLPPRPHIAAGGDPKHLAILPLSCLPSAIDKVMIFLDLITLSTLILGACSKMNE